DSSANEPMVFPVDGFGGASDSAPEVDSKMGDDDIGIDATQIEDDLGGEQNSSNTSGSSKSSLPHVYTTTRVVSSGTGYDCTASGGGTACVSSADTCRSGTNHQITNND